MLFSSIAQGTMCISRWIVTDKLKSYSAALREIMPALSHCSNRYANNRAEVSHEPTRQWERLMRGFKSIGQAQRFFTVHAEVGNLFRIGRHLMKAHQYREFRSRSYSEWQQVTCAQ